MLCVAVSEFRQMLQSGAGGLDVAEVGEEADEAGQASQQKLFPLAVSRRRDGSESQTDGATHDSAAGGDLQAIACGAVFMGANSYIGNGPNFMVKAIVEEMIAGAAEILSEGLRSRVKASV